MIDGIASTFPLDKALLQESINVGIQAKTRGADTIYIALASVLKASIVTFDKEQAQRGESIVNTILLG